MTLEAAACGVPTVGTNVGYVADLAPDAATAVRVRDPRELASPIARMLADRPLRDRVAAAARNWALAHDADWSAANFEQLYRSTVR